MPRTFSETRDPLERANEAFLRSTYPEYIEFWESQIGFRDAIPQGDLLRPYELIDATGNVVEGDPERVLDLIAAYHYSQLVHIVSARTECDKLGCAIRSVTLSDAERAFQCWMHFGHVYLHLDTVLELEYAMWEMLAALNGTALDSANGRNDKMKEVLRALRSSVPFTDISSAYSEIDNLRNFVAHRSIFARKIDSGLLTFALPNGKIKTDDLTPQWTVQLSRARGASFVQRDPVDKASKDITLLINALRKLRPSMQQIWVAYRGVKGYSYRPSSTGTTYTTLTFDMDTQPDVEAGFYHYAPSGMIYDVHAIGSGSATITGH